MLASSAVAAIDGKAGIKLKTESGDTLQESLADAKVSARQQCVYEDP